MTNWQFLIQKQGEHRWYPLESSTVELPEGKYRVVANSNYANIDVEVRVTHYSHHESPPKRYVKKRSRRTNGDGVMAVIPFTALKPGSWELRCSGDLMSDMMGQSWKFIAHLEVLPNDACQNLVTDAGGIGVVSHHPDSVMEQSLTNKQSQEPVNSDVEQLVTPASLNDDHLGDATITISAEQVTLTSIHPTKEESVTSPTNPHFHTLEDVNSSGVTNVLDSSQPDGVTVTPHTSDRESAGEENTDDEFVSPVLLKGKTAEQIIQNLADLALPANEPALEEEEKVDDLPPEVAELPLIITLDTETYFVPWGETFTIHGEVELKDMGVSPRIYGGELQIELRSPQGGAAIAQTRQAITEDTLPLNFTCDIKVPGDCPSKLILAEINLYAAMDAGSESILLASHGFTITAAVNELLALSAVAQSHTAEELLNFSEIVVTDNTREETKVSTPLDLQLFNLVKTLPKQQSLVTQPKVKSSLPPRIDPYSLQKPAPSRSPQLPNFPLNSNQNQKRKIVATTQATTDKPRRKTRGTALPYLKRLQPLVTSQQETQSDGVIGKNSPAGETSPIPRDDNQTQEKTVNPIESPALPNAELITTTNRPNSPSPLIRQWIQAQGYTLSEPINVQYQNYDTDLIFIHELDVDSGIIPKEPSETINELDNVDSGVVPKEPSETINELDNVDSGIIPKEPSETINELDNVDSGIIPKELAETRERHHQSISLTNHQHQPTWLAQEIVVDDIIFPEGETTHSPIAEQQPPPAPEPQLLSPPETTVEPLPIPQVDIPTGELIAGKLIKARVKLPNLGSHIAIKLWIKDCQTRQLINEPHILTNWLPEPPEHLQLTTTVQVPFGCLQIQLEAIAIDLTTQQESHKVSIVRSVIPEDLPNIPTDELSLGFKHNRNLHFCP